MQVAKLFGTLGFNVDTTGLDVFESKLKDLRLTTARFALSLKTVSRELTDVKRKVNSLNSSLKTKNFGSGSASISQNYKSMAANMAKVEAAAKSMLAVEVKLVSFLDNIRTKVRFGAKSWEQYASNVKKAKIELNELRNTLNAIHTQAGRITVNVRGANGLGGHGGGAGGSAAGSAAAGALGGAVGAARGFLRPMLPAAAIAGGFVSAGFGLNKVIETGREMIKVNQVLTATTENSEHLARTWKYVKEEADRLGLSVTELGFAYGKTLQATGGKLNESQINEMFTNVSELMTVYNLNNADQKGVFRAITQMFTTGKVQADELNQLAERNIPSRKLMKEAAMEVYNVTSAEYEKLQKDGKILTVDVLPTFARLMGEMANKNGALQSAVKSSTAAQGRFNNSLMLFSESVFKNGGDQALASLFDGMAKLVVAAIPLAIKILDITNAFTTFIATVHEVTDGNKLLILTLLGGGGLLFIFAKYGRLIFTVGRMLVGMNGGLLATLAIGARAKLMFGLFALTLWGVYEVGKALYDQQNGGENWLTVLQNQLGAMISEFDTDIQYLLTRWELFWIEFDEIGLAAASRALGDGWLGYLLNPMDWATRKKREYAGMAEDEGRTMSTTEKNIRTILDLPFIKMFRSDRNREFYFPNQNQQNQQSSQKPQDQTLWLKYPDGAVAGRVDWSSAQNTYIVQNG